MLHLYLFSTAIFMLTALLNLLTACLHPSCSLAAQDFLLLLILIMSIFLMKELTRIFTLSSIILVNAGTLFLCLFFHHFSTSVKISMMLTRLPPLVSISLTVRPLCRVWRQARFFSRFFCFPLATTPLMLKKKIREVVSQ